jgi:AraC-like DNA-binding protein
MPTKYGFHYLSVTKTDIQREIYVTSVGRLMYKPDASYPCAGHHKDYNFEWAQGREIGDFAAVLIERGSGEFEDDRLGRVPWVEGEILLLPPGAWHRYRPTREVGWTESWVCANGSLLHRLRAKGFFPRTPLLRKLGEPAAFRMVHAILHKMSRNGNSLQLSAYALACFGAALEGLELGHRGDTLTVTGNDLADRAIEFILLNCHHPLNVTIVAEALHTTRRTLERTFGRAHVRSVAEEIAWSRLERARLMFAEGHMSLKEIGYATGFGGTKRLVATLRRLRQPMPMLSQRMHDRH